MKKVYSHENLTQVHTAKGLLELNGIACEVHNEHHAGGGHVGLASIPIELWVLETGDETRAISILQNELGKDSDKPEWTCPQCQEVNAGSFDSCWQCGTVRPG